MKEIVRGVDERLRKCADLPERIIRIDELERVTAMSRQSIYGAIKKGAFPKPVRTMGRSVAWLESEVLAWFEQLKKARDAQQ